MSIKFLVLGGGGILGLGGGGGSADFIFMGAGASEVRRGTSFIHFLSYWSPSFFSTD